MFKRIRINLVFWKKLFSRKGPCWLIENGLSCDEELYCNKKWHFHHRGVLTFGGFCDSVLHPFTNVCIHFFKVRTELFSFLWQFTSLPPWEPGSKPGCWLILSQVWQNFSSSDLSSGDPLTSEPHSPHAPCTVSSSSSAPLISARKTSTFADPGHHQLSQ